MFRILFEFLLTLVIIIVARAVLNSFLKGISTASSNAFQQPSPDTKTGPNAGTQRNGTPPSSGSNLHKDPICGTYVVETTPFQRQGRGQTFYYCSDACRVKHSIAMR